ELLDLGDLLFGELQLFLHALVGQQVAAAEAAAAEAARRLGEGGDGHGGRQNEGCEHTHGVYSSEGLGGTTSDGIVTPGRPAGSTSCARVNSRSSWSDRGRTSMYTNGCCGPSASLVRAMSNRALASAAPMPLTNDSRPPFFSIAVDCGGSWNTYIFFGTGRK